MSLQESLRKRAALLLELHGIVQAMKNVAFAELQRVMREKLALARALSAVAGGLARCGQTWPADDKPPRHPERTSWLVIGAERGFCGTFNARLLESVRSVLHADTTARVLLASRRAGDRLDAADRGYRVLPGCAAVEDASAALDGWLAALDDEARQSYVVYLLYTTDSGVVRRRLLPAPDLAGIAPEPVPPDGVEPPAHYLPMPVLRAALQRQVIRLLVQSALYASLEQENRSRLTQMQQAQDHLERLGAALQRRQAALRQADITNELETLTSILSR